MAEQLSQQLWRKGGFPPALPSGAAAGAQLGQGLRVVLCSHGPLTLLPWPVPPRGPFPANCLGVAKARPCTCSQRLPGSVGPSHLALSQQVRLLPHLSFFLPFPSHPFSSLPMQSFLYKALGTVLGACKEVLHIQEKLLQHLEEANAEEPSEAQVRSPPSQLLPASPVCPLGRGLLLALLRAFRSPHCCTVSLRRGPARPLWLATPVGSGLRQLPLVLLCRE